MNKHELGLEKFIKVCLSINNKKDYLLVLDLFLTPEEKTDLGMRFLIVKELLKQEKTQREIAKDLNVSIAKITRGSNELKRLDSKFLTLLRNLILN